MCCIAGMFIGHYAPALIAAAHPKAQRLGVLFIAAQAVDLAFFTFALVGIEHFRLTPQATVTNALDLYDLPYTHSLLGTLGFAAAWALATRLAGGSRTAGWIGAGVVASHWLLDWLVHAPDLTIAGIGRRHGLGLWNWPLTEMPLELAMVALALVFYASHTTAHGRPGHQSLAVLTLALFAAQLANWLTPQPTEILDPAPAATSVQAIAAFVILAALAAWVARTRRPSAT